MLPPSGRHLTSREEETLVAKELRDEMRVKRYLQEGGTSSQRPGKGRGRGSGAPRPEARNVSGRRERGAEQEWSWDGKSQQMSRPKQPTTNNQQPTRRLTQGCPYSCAGVLSVVET